MTDGFACYNPDCPAYQRIKKIDKELQLKENPYLDWIKKLFRGKKNMEEKTLVDEMPAPPLPARDEIENMDDAPAPADEDITGGFDITAGAYPKTPPEPDRIKPKIVEIEWEDVMSYETCLLDDNDLRDITPATAYLIGYLVGEDDKYYFVAKEWWNSHQFKYLHVVPKRVVKNVRYYD